MELFDVIVVGAGIEGSATAYHLAKGNHKTLLLEQFLLPHTRGSSHGQSRIIRKAYDKKFYAEMMNEAFSSWHTLEKETSTNLYQKTGLLLVGRPPRGSDYVNRTEKALASQNAIYQTLNSTQINQRFPMMKFDEGDHGVYEQDAGILKADKALACFHKVFVQHGGVLRDGEPVTKVVPGDLVTIETSKQQYKARSVVLTVGPWAPKMLKTLGLNLPLKLLRVKVSYWKQVKAEYGLDQGFPCFFSIGFRPDDEGRYGSPSYEYPQHVKVCSHIGDEIDPDSRDVGPVGTEDTREVAEFIEKHLPGLDPVPSIQENCIYSMSPDDDFTLDSHPLYKNIIIGAGFSGHGFKLAPVVGKILGSLALQHTGVLDQYNMKAFQLKRFGDSVLSAKSKM